MKQYLLKNKSTNEEVLCTKVVVDGFDYYVSECKILKRDYVIFCDKNLLYQVEYQSQEYDYNNDSDCKKVIATNNPSIDIPKVISDAEVANINRGIDKANGYLKDEFVIGYNTHASTHTLSDDEVVEFNDWCIKNYCCEILFSGKWYKRNGDDETEYTSKELLQLFKEQQIKTLIYG